MRASLKKAITKYKKEKCKIVTVNFCPPDMMLYNYVKNHNEESMSAFIKSCIKEKMLKEKQNG